MGSAIELEDESSDQAKHAVSSEKQEPASNQQVGPLKSALKKPQKAAPKPADGDSDSYSEWEPVQKASSSSQPSRPEDPLLPNGQLDVDIITAEAMTLAQSLATKRTKPSDLIDDSFNKFSFRDVDGLPEWFLDDESHHSKPQRPITAAAAAAIKEKLRALNAQPIKKVLAAKKGRPKEKVKLVVARGGNRGIAGRPRGVKGKYKIVDPRLKKDVRAEKRLKKKLKK